MWSSKPNRMQFHTRRRGRAAAATADWFVNALRACGLAGSSSIASNAEQSAAAAAILEVVLEVVVLSAQAVESGGCVRTHSGTRDGCAAAALASPLGRPLARRDAHIPNWLDCLRLWLRTKSTDHKAEVRNLRTSRLPNRGVTNQRKAGPGGVRGGIGTAELSKHTHTQCITDPSNMLALTDICRCRPDGGFGHPDEMSSDVAKLSTSKDTSIQPPRAHGRLSRPPTRLLMPRPPLAPYSERLVYLGQIASCHAYRGVMWRQGDESEAPSDFSAGPVGYSDSHDSDLARPRAAGGTHTRIYWGAKHIVIYNGSSFKGPLGLFTLQWSSSQPMPPNANARLQAIYITSSSPAPLKP